MYNWNVPDTLIQGQAPVQQPMTPYAAFRAKNPMPQPGQMPQMPTVTAPQNGMPTGAIMSVTPRPQTAIGYGVPGNPVRQRGF